MGFLVELWLAILIASALVFVASSLLHMVLPIHRGDVKKMPGEDGVLDAMRDAGVTPGDYMFPCAESMKAMESPEMKAKFERGPVGFLTVLPGMSVGKSLVHWFGFLILVNVFVAYLTHAAVPSGAEYFRVFRISGTLATMVYALGPIPNSIWKGQAWTTTFKFVFDGIIYGLVTAGAFAGFWPDA